MLENFRKIYQRELGHIDGEFEKEVLNSKHVRMFVYEICKNYAAQPTVEEDAGKCVCWYDGCTCEFRDKKGMCNC